MVGAAFDARDRHPIALAGVEVAERPVERMAGGGARLRPLAEARPIATGRTDLQGRFSLMLPRRPAWVTVRVRAAGYFGQQQGLVRTDAARTAALSFFLFPDESLLAVPQAGAGALTGAGPEAVATAAAAPAQVGAPDAWAPATLRPEWATAAETGAGPIPTPGPAAFEVPETVPVQGLGESGFSGLIDLDELISGTVTAEMNDGFPFEALKAQAVASRTYALDRLKRRGFANGGQAYSPLLGAKSQAATFNTTRTVLLYGGQVFPAYFAARCNGDYTLNSEDGTSLAQCRPGSLGAGIVPWARSRPCSGHAHCGEVGTVCCVLDLQGRSYHVYGHGVGLCQRGAQEFAGRDGWSWLRILTQYYTGITVANAPALDVDHPVVTLASMNLRAEPGASAVLARLPAGSTGWVLSGPERVPSAPLSAPYAYLTWWEVRFADGQQGWVAEDFLQRHGAPWNTIDLRIDRVGSSVRLSWKTTGPVELQSAADLRPPILWRAWTLLPAANGDRLQVELDPGQSLQFFRLRLR